MMKSNKLWLALMAALLASSVASTLASGGEKTGNGSDNPRMEDRIAWFENADRVIRYCWLKDERFGLKDAELEAAVQDAFGAWRDYLATKKVNHSLQAIGGSPFATQVQRISRCDGTEDLRLYFGTSDKTVERQKRRHNNPTAFTALTSFDYSQRWGKGLIWLAMPGSVASIVVENNVVTFPNWQNREQIQAILRHEIGHVLGCDHVTGTIMDADISEELLNQLAPGQHDHLTSIDRYRQLFVCWECTLNFVGEVGWTDKDSNDDAAKTFRLWTGRDPVGPVTGKLANTAWNQPLSLEITDSTGATRIELERPHGNEHPFFSNEGMIFSSLRFEQVSDNQSVMSVTSLIHASAVTYSFGKTQTGGRLPIMTEINSDRMGVQGPLTIKYFTDAGVRTLFRAQTQETD